MRKSRYNNILAQRTECQSPTCKSAGSEPSVSSPGRIPLFLPGTTQEIEDLDSTLTKARLPRRIINAS